MLATHDALPGLPGFRGAAAYAALPGYAAALHELAGLGGPPYDPLQMAQALGVRVRAVPTYQGTRGLLVPLRHGVYQILVRGEETRGAQRFTVAHELVELGLQVGCPTLVERSYHDPGAGRAKERFCEVGAAEILLPLARVRQEVHRRAAGIEALGALAGCFGSSLHAMLWRMIEAAAQPCAGLILSAAEHVSANRDGLGLPRAAAPARLVVRAAWGGGGLRTQWSTGMAIPTESVLARCHRERDSLQATEQLALGRLQGRFHIEATCPGRGAQRHVYALLYPC